MEICQMIILSKQNQQLIERTASAYGIDPNLIGAVVVAESGGDTFAVRYEPLWKYFFEVEEFAKLSRITNATETMLQACSFGLMQIMGSVARELGHESSLLQLAQPEIGLMFGCKKLRALIRNYPDLANTVAAYNAGTPRMNATTGKYSNQDYVDKVTGLVAQKLIG